MFVKNLFLIILSNYIKSAISVSYLSFFDGSRNNFDEILNKKVFLLKELIAPGVIYVKTR